MDLPKKLTQLDPPEEEGEHLQIHFQWMMNWQPDDSTTKEELDGSTGDGLSSTVYAQKSGKKIIVHSLRSNRFNWRLYTILTILWLRRELNEKKSLETPFYGKNKYKFEMAEEE